MIIINKLNEKNEEPLISDDDNADVLKKQSLPPMKDYLDVINIKLPKSNSYSFKDDTATGDIFNDYSLVINKYNLINEYKLKKNKNNKNNLALENMLFV